MSTRTWIILLVSFLFIASLAACYPNPQPPGLTPVPSLAPAATLTLLPAIHGGKSSSGAEAVGTPDPGFRRGNLYATLQPVSRSEW